MLEPYDLLHFAAHTHVLDQAPWQSDIELGSDEGSCLQARQVASLHLQASLVVLSSCESAQGVILSGEGVTGLPWPSEDVPTPAFRLPPPRCSSPWPGSPSGSGGGPARGYGSPLDRMFPGRVPSPRDRS